MSDINDQGPQNVAQAEAEAVSRYLTDAELALYGADGTQPVSVGRVAQWCAAKVAAEVERATAALRERIEAAEAEHEDSVVRTNRALRERVEKAEAALAKMTGERDRYCADYMREAALAEEVGSDRAMMIKTNFRLVAERDEARAEVARLREESKDAHGRDLRSEVARVCDLLESKPYTPRVGDAFTWDGRHFIFSGPAERAAAGLPSEPAEAPAAPRVLPEHLALLEFGAAYLCMADNGNDGWARMTKAADALNAAVARRDGGGK